jgi:hypothetical protein
LSPRERGWIDLRERLAHAAREIHFSAFSSGTPNSAALLAIAGNLAGLAMSIPLEPARVGSSGPVDASTLLATQILQLALQTQSNSNSADAD